MTNRLTKAERAELEGILDRMEDLEERRGYQIRFVFLVSKLLGRHPIEQKEKE